VDLEVSIGNSWEEAAGNAYRTDFDLKSHQSMSNQDMSVVDMDKKVLPHVVEVSLGLDRIFWGLLHNSLYRDGKRDWDVLLLAEDIAPYKYALFPLQKDDKIIAKSVEIGNLLKSRGIYPYYSVSGSIGKRYAKADEVGIPMAITIDYETLENGTVTIRKALDGGQTRVKFEDIR
jgi:glycyl-tRNA synthetase